ncbi:unnamed protein product, partial [Musa textilis]
HTFRVELGAGDYRHTSLRSWSQRSISLFSDLLISVSFSLRFALPKTGSDSTML